MITLYPCIHGWKQFYSTRPNHWCACEGEANQIEYRKLYLEYIEVRPNCYLSIVQNAADVPSDRYVNFMGWITDLNYYHKTHGQVYINSKSLNRDN